MTARLTLLANWFPPLGEWTESNYLALNRATNQFAELSDGTVDVLDSPTLTHQRIVARLNEKLTRFIEGDELGTVVLAPYPLRLWESKFREPDLLFAKTEHTNWLTEKRFVCKMILFSIHHSAFSI